MILVFSLFSVIRNLIIRLSATFFSPPKLPVLFTSLKVAAAFVVSSPLVALSSSTAHFYGRIRHDLDLLGWVYAVLFVNFVMLMCHQLFLHFLFLAPTNLSFPSTNPSQYYHVYQASFLCLCHACNNITIAYVYNGTQILSIWVVLASRNAPAVNAPAKPQVSVGSAGIVPAKPDLYDA